MSFIFFDEINTTPLLSKMKEIFVNHSLNGKLIDERIRFIGACNPYRENKDNENYNRFKFEKTNNDDEEMAYLVNPLPNSMLNYIFYFKSLDNNDIRKYIEIIICEEFPKGCDDDSENSILRNIAIDVIYESHIFLKKTHGISSVSLRDFQKFKMAYKFFNEYYKYKNEFLINNGDKVDIKSKVQSFALSIFIIYYIRINKPECNNNFLEKINYKIKLLANKFKINEWLSDQNWRQQPFKYIIKEEEDFLLKEMEVRKEKGIGHNTPLKENIFVMFFSIYSHIPLIVVGKSGCSKSLSIGLIIKNMKGELSNSNFLKKYPAISCTYIQGSQIDIPESIENTFKEAKNKKYLSQSEKKMYLY